MAAISAATRPRPLISPEGLHRVVVAAAEDFARIDSWLSGEQREVEEQRLSKSIACAKKKLQDFNIFEAWMQEGVQEQEGPEQDAEQSDGTAGTAPHEEGTEAEPRAELK